MFICALLSVVFKAETTNLGEYGPYAVIDSLISSTDGSAWGFVAEKSDGKCYVIINGKEWGPYEEVGGPSFSSDGSATFYTATSTKPSYCRIDRVKVWVSAK